jgi:hypothetical protein
MKHLFLFIVFCAWMITGLGQPAPGGVKGPVLWYSAQEVGGQAVFRNVKDSSILHLDGKQGLGFLNYRPAAAFYGSGTASFDLDTANVSQASYFTVYKANDISSENIIWHTEKDRKVDLVFTTSRMADLDQVRYMNFTDLQPLNPKVGTYVQGKLPPLRKPLQQRLLLGSRPASPQLPVREFSGLIPEMLVYDRVLNMEEQVRVASYLALKYGITLSEPGASYLGSSGVQVWDGSSYSDYHHNIAGIVRDDASGLLQKMAASSNTPGLLSLAARDNLGDGSFFLWGDNGRPLMVGVQAAGQPVRLQRTWLSVMNGITDSLSTDIVIDTKQFDVALPARPVVYWLAVNRNGEDEFTAAATEYIPMKDLDAKGFARFPGITWKTTPQARGTFSFVVGGPVLLSTELVNPSCSHPNDGQFNTRIWGGLAPYQLEVSKEGKVVFNRTLNEDRVTVQDLASGRYHLKVTDRAGNIYKDEFYLNNSDGPRPVSIGREYTIPAGLRLALDASWQMEEGLAYEWFGPGNFYSLSPKVALTAEGDYVLKVTKNGCSYVQDIVVKLPPRNAFKDIDVYPNPSTGLFTVKLALDKPSNVVMNIYTEDGRLMMQRSFSGYAHYTFTEQLNATGVYYLEFITGLDKSTRKLMVTK